MEFVAKTDVGLKRKNNEDSYFAKIYNDNIALYIVADGLGGYEGGEIASKILIIKVSRYFEEHITDNLTSESNVKEILVKALNIANEEIYNLEKTNEKYNGMGTTIAMVAVVYDKVYYLSVGDSRIYYIDENMLEISQVTEDDTYVNTLVKTNVINETEAETHPQKHVLTKAVGVFKEIDAKAYLFNMEKGYLLLCSDGLTNMLEDEEILNVLRKNKFDNITEKLISKANINGGVDNITAVVIKL